MKSPALPQLLAFIFSYSYSTRKCLSNFFSECPQMSTISSYFKPVSGIFFKVELKFGFVRTSCMPCNMTIENA